jgi:hypothetical protein
LEFLAVGGDVVTVPPPQMGAAKRALGMRALKVDVRLTSTAIIFESAEM